VQLKQIRHIRFSAPAWTMVSRPILYCTLGLFTPYVIPNFLFWMDTEKCLMKLISESALTEFKGSGLTDSDQINIFDDYFSFVQVLNEPEHRHQSLLMSEDVSFPENVSADRPGPSSKKRRIEKEDGSGSNAGEAEEFMEEVGREGSKFYAADEPESEFMSSDPSFPGSSFIDSPSWLQSGSASNGESLSGTGPCLCRQDLINSLLSMMLGIWRLWGECQ